MEIASLSQSFFDELTKHPVPVEEAAVRQLANNSLALDVYCWLAYRLHSLKEPITVSWKALHGQFGRSVARFDHFKEHFRSVLLLATSVYPDAKVEEAPSGAGLGPETIETACSAQGRRGCSAPAEPDPEFPVNISRPENTRSSGESSPARGKDQPART